MSKPIVGCQLYSLREYTKTPEDAAETLKKVAAMGYTAVQVSGFGVKDAKEIVKMCDDNGLAIGSTHMGWPRFQNELDALIEEHQIMKCKHPAVGGVPGEYHTEEGLKKFIGELGPIVEKLNAAGMDFSYHNHNHELAKHGGRTWLGALYEDTSPDLLKAEIDTHWITAGGGDPIQWIDKVAGRMPILHLKDFIVTPDRERRFAPIGEGNLNWEGILAAAERAGVEYMMVEQDQSYEDNALDCMAISYRNLKAMGYE